MAKAGSLEANLQGCKDPPVGMTPDTDAALCSAMVVPAGQPPPRRTQPNEGGQEDEWAAYVALETCGEGLPRDHLPVAGSLLDPLGRRQPHPFTPGLLLGGQPPTMGISHAIGIAHTTPPVSNVGDLRG